MHTRNVAITGLAGLLLTGAVGAGIYFKSRADPELAKNYAAQTQELKLSNAERDAAKSLYGSKTSEYDKLHEDWGKEIDRRATAEAKVELQDIELTRRSGVSIENEGLKEANAALKADNTIYGAKNGELTAANTTLTGENTTLTKEVQEYKTEAQKRAEADAKRAQGDAEKQTQYDAKIAALDGEKTKLSARVSELEAKTFNVNINSQTSDTTNSGAQVQPVQPSQDDNNSYAWSYVMEHYGKDREPTGESSLIALTKTGEYVILDGETRQIRTAGDGAPLVFTNYEAAGNGIQKFVDDAGILPVYPNKDRQVFRSTWYNPLSKNGVPLPIEIANDWKHAHRTSYAILPTLGAITGTLNTFLIEGNLRNTIPTNALKHATENVPVVRRVTRGLDKLTQGTAASLVGGSDFNQSGADAMVGNEAASWYRTGPFGWLTHSYSDADNFAYGNGYRGNPVENFFQGALDTYETLVKAASLGLIYKAPDLIKGDGSKSGSGASSDGGNTYTGGDN